MDGWLRNVNREGPAARAPLPGHRWGPAHRGEPPRRWVARSLHGSGAAFPGPSAQRLWAPAVQSPLPAQKGRAPHFPKTRRARTVSVPCPKCPAEARL